MDKMGLSRRRMLLGTGASLASMALARVACAVPTVGSQSSGSTGIDPKDKAGSMGWTIGNDQVQRRIRFDNSLGLFTEGFSDLKSSTELVRQDGGHDKPSPEFSFVVDGRHTRGSSSAFHLVGAEESKLPKGKLLEIHLKNAQIPLEVTVCYAIYDGHPAVRKWLTIKNAGPTAVCLTHLDIEAIAPSFGPSNETSLNALYGTNPRELLYTGRSEDAGLFLSNARTGSGLAILSEVPGYMKRTEINGFYDPERVHIDVLYDTDLMPFSRWLAPAESFTTAAVSMVLFRNGDRLQDPRWVLPSYTSEILQRRNGAEGAPWIYNTWNPFERKIDSATTHPLIGIAGRMGIDIFTIDDGWQQDYGENQVNLSAFPEGLDPIRKRVEAEGMRLGLWIPLAAIAANTVVGREHADWIQLDQAGQRKTTTTAAGEMVVMCLATGFAAMAAARINEAIERFHLAYVKLDLTTIFNAYGEAPGCWAKGHDHRDWSESLGMIYEGIRKVTSAVYRSHPDVLLDLTFELWGQKHVIDAGLLAAGDLDWLSNVGDSDRDSAGPIQARTLLYSRAASMPVEAMLIGNLQADIPNPAQVFATALGSAPVMLGDLRKLSAADVEWYRSHIGWFKKLRRETRIDESFFPLGSWRQPVSTEWDGFARLSRSGTGVIVLFRNKSAVLGVSIQLPLMPPGVFHVHSVMTDKSLGDFTLDKWTQGIPVSFAEGQTVEILEVRSLP